MEQTKVCSSCGLKKPLSEFNKNRNTKDGLQDKCRACFSRYNKARYWANPERFKQGVREYRDGNLENVFATRMSMCEKNPSEKNAREAVSLAVKLGYIEKPDHCFGCGKTDTYITAHHADYSKPLDVVWVCPKCHRHLDANRREEIGLPRYGNMRKVAMLVDGNVACTFDTISEASKAVGRKPNTISQCLAGISRKCAGFEWRYVED